MPTKQSHTTEPDKGTLDQTEEVIRLRAYGYYQERGGDHGHDLEDWLRAEAEIVGSNASESVGVREKGETTSVAA